MNVGTDALIYKGREYVSIKEFAARMGVSRQAIERKIKNNVLRTTSLNGYRTKYLDYEVQKLEFLKNHKRETLKVPKKAPALKEISNKEAPEMNAPSIPPMPAEGINVQKLNPNDYPDCWIRDPSGEPVRNPVTKLPEFDYDRLKDRLTAEKYQMDIDEKRGKYIAREELTRTIASIATIINAGLNAIPNRYGAILIAKAEGITGHEFTPDERASMRSVLKKEAGAIMNSVRTEIAKMADSDEEETEEESTEALKEDEA
jgi:hypothetical protein